MTKGDQKIVVFEHARHAGIAYAMIDRMAADNVVLAQYGYGRTDAADGRVWPWVFTAAGQLLGADRGQDELHRREGRRHRQA